MHRQIESTEPLDATRGRRVELILSQIDALPTLSPIATRLLELSSDDESDIKEIVALIESDPSLTSKILGLCRRADKGLGDRITTVKHAVLMLGLSAVQAAVLSVDVFELLDSHRFDNIDAEAYCERTGTEGLDRVGFWKHAVAVACASELLAEASPALEVSPEEAFVAGLLHDLGKLVLDMILPRSYARVAAMCEQRQCSTADVERTVIGIDHHTAGKRLAEHWSLPHVLQDVLWLHSQPMAGIPDLPHKPIIGVVTAAKGVCRSLLLGWSGEFGPPPDVVQLCLESEIDPAMVEVITPNLHENIARRCAALGIDQQNDSGLLLQSVMAANRKLGRMYEMLSARSEAGKHQARALDAICAFHRAWKPARGIVDVCEQVAQSAISALGAGHYAILFRPRDREPWQLCRFSREGSRCGAELIDEAWDPFSSGNQRATTPPGVPVDELPWLVAHLRDAPEASRLRVLVMNSASGGPVVALVHDRPLAPPHIGIRELSALLATWASAITSAAQHEGARRLGEQLAHTNRSLAQMQAQWAEAQSLVRLGEMASGAAHEMNNPLTVISGRSQMLARAAENPRDRAAAASIAEAAQDLANLITGLRLLADPPELSLARVSVERVVADAAAIASGRANVNDRVSLEFSPEVGTVSCDPELFENALSEVIVNAIESDADTRVRIRADRDGNTVRLIVADGGPGFTERALRHAFDPFFSDKPAGRQTGLGLSRSRRLIELHGGSITIANRPGGGAQVVILLPDVAHAQAAPNGPDKRDDHAHAA
ncbi:MAG: HDOD domain-containing protein [Planctomycetes bacterium]|nr:HDOD domain-containing protein [Planctomycetota bacterium]